MSDNVEDWEVVAVKMPDGSLMRLSKPPGMPDEEVKAFALQQFAQNAPKPQVVPPDNTQMGARNLARSAAQGGTFGFQDELQALLGAGADYATGHDTDFAKNYAGLRDAERADQRAFSGAHPKADFAAQMAGGMLPVSRALGTAKAGWTGLAQTGAKLGALAGLGTAEGDIPEQAINTGLGAGLGAGLSVAAPWAVQQGGNLVKGAGSMAMSAARAMAPQATQNAQTFIERSIMAMQNKKYIQMAQTAPRVEDQNHQRLLWRADELGFKTTPGVRQNNIDVRNMEASMKSNPLNPIGSSLHTVGRENYRNFEKMVADRIGLPKGTQIYDVTVGARQADVGASMNQIGSAIPKFKISDEWNRGLKRILGQATDPAALKPGAAKIVRQLQNLKEFNTGLTGKRAMDMRSKWNAKMSAAYKTPGGFEEAELYRELIGLLDKEIGKHVAPKLTSEWATLRSHYKLIMALKSPNVLSKLSGGPGGNINTASLAGALRRSYSDFALAKDVARGGGVKGDDLFDSVRLLNGFGDLVNNSGTATRSATMRGDGVLGLDTMAGLAASRVAAPFAGAAYNKVGPSVIADPGLLAQHLAIPNLTTITPILQEATE